MMIKKRKETKLDKLIAAAAEGDVFKMFLSTDDSFGYFSERGSHGNWYADSSKDEVYTDPKLQKYYEERVVFWTQSIIGNGEKNTIGTIIKEFSDRDAPDEKRFLDGWDLCDLEEFYHSISEDRSLPQDEIFINKFLNDFIDYLHTYYDSNSSYEWDAIKWRMAEFANNYLAKK